MKAFFGTRSKLTRAKKNFGGWLTYKAILSVVSALDNAGLQIGHIFLMANI